MRGLLMMCAVGFAACIQSGAAVCPDGKVCAEGTTCRVVSNGARGDADEVCATESQRDACKDQPDRHRCGGTSHCFDGVCLPPECGNGRLDKDPNDSTDASTEVCDDGNQLDHDGCSAHCDSDETCGNGVLDALIGETCDDGNLVQHDGCDSKCRTEDPRWQLLTSAPAIGRADGAMAYDAARGRVVLFGGFDNDNGVPLNDTWEWDGQAWLLLDPATRPAPRSGHAMVYDAARHAVVLFGGSNGDDSQVFQDTWEWDGDTWIPLAAQRSPTARVGFGMVYDAGRQRVVLFGGVSTSEPVVRVLTDTWEWDGTTWTPIAMTPGASLPGAVGAMAYDPERGRTVLFGGGQVAETWEYAGATHQWTQVAATGPTPRSGSAMAYDLAKQRIVMFGGIGDDLPLDETWAYDGVHWTQLPTSAIGKASFMMASDVARRRVVIFGGKRDDTTWEWDGTSWVETAQVRAPPQAAPVVAYDPERATTTLVGSVFISDPPQRMFDYDGLGLVSIDPPNLPPFVSPAMTFDPGRRVVVLFDPRSAATWEWDGTRWALARPGVSPPELVGAALAYDHINGRVLLFGGGGELFPPQAATWGWNGVNWGMVSTAHAPPARSNASIGWDPIHREIVLFGGRAADGSRRGDTWVWDGSDWLERTPMAPMMMSPEPRELANMAWNASRGRLVLFGGSDLGPLFDTWEWDGAAWKQLAIGNGPTARTGAAMFPASDGSGVFAFGGSTGSGLGGHANPELWRLRWMGSHTSESCFDSLDLDDDGRKGCDDPDCWWVCRPSEPPGAPPAPLAPHCGDGVCNQALENCRICPQDCTCTPVCGDYFCDPPETAASCPGDCGS